MTEQRHEEARANIGALMVRIGLYYSIVMIKGP